MPLEHGKGIRQESRLAPHGWIVHADQGDVAILFGRESSGLTNEEMDSCGYLVHIPCNPEFSSLNVASAIQVVAYEMRMCFEQDNVRQTEVDESEEVATSDELEGFYQHMEQALVEIDFLDPEKPRKLMRRLRRLYNRASLQPREVNILRGVLSAAQRQAQLAARNETEK